MATPGTSIRRISVTFEADSHTRQRRVSCTVERETAVPPLELYAAFATTVDGEGTQLASPAGSHGSQNNATQQSSARFGSSYSRRRSSITLHTSTSHVLSPAYAASLSHSQHGFYAALNTDCTDAASPAPQSPLGMLGGPAFDTADECPASPVIGRGTFGSVHLVDASPRQFALPGRESPTHEPLPSSHLGRTDTCCSLLDAAAHAQPAADSNRDSSASSSDFHVEAQFLAAQKVIQETSASRSRSAITELAFAERAIAAASRERGVWANIVEVYEARRDEAAGVTTILMEYMAGGRASELPEFARDFRGPAAAVEARVAAVAADALRGLVTLHETLRVAHRDVKPDNILITEKGIAKLADFGIAVELGPDGLVRRGGQREDQGTLMFLAPERLRGGDDVRYGAASDVWALGVALLQLASGGHHPFAPRQNGPRPHLGLHLGNVLRPSAPMPETQAAVRATVAEALELPDCRVRDPIFRHFIQQCLTADPVQRPSAAALLQHAFVRTFAAC